MKQKQTKKIRLNLDFFYQLAAVIVGILLSVTLVRNVLIIASANKKIQKTKNEILELEQKNEILKKQIEIAQTAEFKEKQARDKLGFVKEGEVVIVLPDE
ncbi:MAG: septum formation initiator family protein, partial [Patescibacteria group bacterium]